MASRKPAVKHRLLEFLSETGAERVTEADWASLRERFPETSSSYLRRILRDSGRSLDPVVEGVRQDGFDELERTLLGLERVYSDARDKDDVARQRLCRELVKEARDHARWAARKSQKRETEKAKVEMMEWMLVWLEDPAAFRIWVNLRKRHRGAGAAESKSS